MHHAPDLDARCRTLLRADSIAGVSAGVGMLLLHDWLTALYRLPSTLIWGITAANLLYGATSGTIVLRQPTPLAAWTRRMGAANVGWAAVCTLIAVRWVGVASAFGVAALIAEALFVGTLGVMEWRAGRRAA
jgi:hypothetical protein